jgi:hypothetical protein
MKKTKQLLYCACLLLFFSACTTYKIVENDVNVERLKGKEAGNQQFFIKSNDEKVIAREIKIPSTGNGNNIIVDGKKIYAPEVIAFQNAQGYYTWLKSKPSSKWGIWINRLRAGQINLYFYGDIRNRYYVFEKGKGNLVDLTYKSFSQALSDKKDVLQKFQSLYPKQTIGAPFIQENLSKLISVVELYNSK